MEDDNALSLPDLYARVTASGVHHASAACPLRFSAQKFLPPALEFLILLISSTTPLLLPGLVTRLIELARDEDLGMGGNPGDLTCQVTLEESHT
jgi:hypothetical protein